MTLEKFCCICVKKYPHLENVNETDDENVKYHDKLSVCVPNQEWSEDYNICKNCVEQLDSAYKFVQACIKSDKLRREQLRIIKKENEPKNEEIIETEELFICNICKKQFKLKRSFKLHVTRIHNKKDKTHTEEQLQRKQLSIVKKENEPKDEESIETEELFICDICKKEFKLKRSLKLHVTRIHNKKEKTHTEEGVKPERIEDCIIEKNNLFKSEELPKTEEEKIDDDASDNNYDNNEGSSFSSDEDVKPLETKRKYSKRKNPLTCEYCGKLFHRRQHYSSHIRSKHTFEKPYKCNLCDAKYTNSHSLLVHKRNHNNEKPFICSYCGKSFVCSGDLYHHSKIHLNKREYKCTLCDKSFNTASILRTHKICMHTDPKDWKYTCSFCEKRFPINSSLATHMKRHNGIKEFSCHICAKNFFDKSELTKHFRSHSSVRLYKCNICEVKEYKNRYGLRKHMKIIHDIGTLKITKPVKKFLCPMCPKIFAFNNKLQKHIYTHTGEKPHKCDYCDKKFIDNYYRKVHLKKKHNIELNEEYV